MHEVDHRAQKGIVVGQGLGRTSQMAASEGQGEREKNEGPSRVEKGHCGYEQRGLGPMQPRQTSRWPRCSPHSGREVRVLFYEMQNHPSQNALYIALDSRRCHKKFVLS